MDPLQQGLLDLVNWSNTIHPTLFNVLKAIYNRYYPATMSGMGADVTSAAPFNVGALLKTLDNVVTAAAKYMQAGNDYDNLKAKVAELKNVAFNRTAPVIASGATVQSHLSSIPPIVWVGVAGLAFWYANKKHWI